MKYKMGFSNSKSSGVPGRPSFKPTSMNFTTSKGVKRSPTLKQTHSIHGRPNYRRFSMFASALSARLKRKKPLTGGGPSKPTSRKQKIKKALGRILTVSLGVGFVTTIVVMIAMGIYLKNLRKLLPDPDQLINRDVAQSSVLYDRNGKELYKIYDGEVNREFIKIEDVPDHTKWALLAAEDDEFYQHKGLDWKGIVRCVYLSGLSYISDGSEGIFCGASTISQQLVRNTLLEEALGDDAYARDTTSFSGFYKAVRRKMMEWLLTMQVEQTLSKDEILQIYMNEIPLGGVNYGFEAAAQAYFGKSVKELDLAESALIAALIQQPGVYAPIGGTNPELGEARQKTVLDLMLKHNNVTGVTKEEVEAAKAEILTYQPGQIDIEAYHFVFYVKKLLEDEFGPEVVQRGGLKVTTTIDMSTQNIAEDELRKGIATLGIKEGAHNGAMIVIDPKTGQILAMVGSIDPNQINDPRIDGNVNITTSLRQMGSSVKPYTYLTAFQRYGPWLEAPDLKEITFGPYDPDNWDGRNMGVMTARQGLIMSRNVPAVYTQQVAGTSAVIQTSEKLGITTLTEPDKYGLSMTLGTAEMKLLEHAQAYGVFATGGIKRNTTPFLKVVNSKGEVLKEFKDQPERVFDEKDIYLLNWVLCDLGSFGDQPLKQYYNIGGKRVLCGKTGTTNGPKDLVSMVYHPGLVVGVWAGNNNGDLMSNKAWSTTIPLPIAHAFIERVISKYPSEAFVRPAGIFAATVCNDTGRLATAETNCPKVATIYAQGRAPQPDKREVLHLCKDTGVISTNYDVAQQFGLINDKIFLNFELENAAQRGPYKAHMEANGFLLEKPASGDCVVPINITITAPAENTTVQAGTSVTVEATATSQNPITQVVFKLDGTTVGTDNTAPFSLAVPIPSGSAVGEHTITVEATDSQGQVASDSVTISVTAPALSVSILTPTAGSSVSTPVAISVGVSGGSATSVRVHVTYTNSGGGTVTQTLNAVWSGVSWLTTFSNGAAVPGPLVIRATATAPGGQTYDSSAVTVTLK